jgi:hypothetical protein
MRTTSVHFIPNIVALILFTVVIILCWNYPPAAKRLLNISAVLGMALSLVLVLQDIWNWRNPDDTGIKEEAKAGRYDISAIQLISSAVWMVSIVPLIFLTGFTIGISLFAFAFYKSHGGSWLASIILGIVLAAIIYFGFVVGMNVLFPKPILYPSVRI